MAVSSRLASLALVLGACATGCLWPAFSDPLYREGGVADASVEAAVDASRGDVVADVAMDREVPHDVGVDVPTSPDVPAAEAGDDAGMPMTGD